MGGRLLCKCTLYIVSTLRKCGLTSVQTRRHCKSHCMHTACTSRQRTSVLLGVYKASGSLTAGAGELPTWVGTHRCHSGVSASPEQMRCGEGQGRLDVREGSCRPL